MTCLSWLTSSTATFTSLFLAEGGTLVYYTKINQQTFAINVLDVSEALQKKANNKATIIKEKENCDK